MPTPVSTAVRPNATLTVIVAIAAVAAAAVSTPPLIGALDHDSAAIADGGARTVTLFVVGWTLMIVAMMLPSAATLLTAVGQLADKPLTARSLQVATAGAFLAIWSAVGFLFRGGDVIIHTVADQLTWTTEHSGLIPGGVLIIAGAFQFSSLKYRCLTACRTPTSFLYRYWRSDKPVANALRVGVAYGLSCAGCCWALMLVMFALGVMSAPWMMVFGATMAVEKNTRFGRRLTTPLGIGLLASGALVAVGA